MKKLFFLFALLASVAASATVTVTPLSVDYSIPKVTFSVSWDGAPYNNRVWVWIDLSPITGTSPGTFEKAEISGATATAGSIETVSGNTRGFYVTTNSTTVTATLSNANGQFNWCVYGSDAPPDVTLDRGTYTFHGTASFIVSSHEQPVTATTIPRTNLTVTLSSTFTDATGCPGIGQLYCPYTGSDLIMDATHLCQQRATGAKNWEAYIRDERDETIYRITQFSDNTWWMAEDMTYATKKISTCGGFSWYRISDNPGCPDGWLLPSNIQFGNRFPTATDDYGGVVVRGNGWHDNGLGCQTYSYALYVVAGCTNCVYRDNSWAYYWCFKNNSQEGDCNSTYYNSGRIRCYR